jgi:hypothetical protein
MRPSSSLSPFSGSDNEHNQASDQADRLPPVPIGMRIRTAAGERIIEYKMGGLEPEPVFPPIDQILALGPGPTHVGLRL